jgi:hypothetical protein
VRRGGHLNAFVPGAGDLKEDLVLLLELDLLVVQTTRQEHGAVEAQRRLAVQRGRGRGCLGLLLGGRGHGRDLSHRYAAARVTSASARIRTT